MTGRDPVSAWWDGAARGLLARAYARPGTWVTTRVRPPTARHVQLAGQLGVDLDGPDPVAHLGGAGINARDRWTRAFIRSLYFQHHYYSGRPGGGWRAAPRAVPRTGLALRVAPGRRVPAAGVLPAGRILRVRVDRGGDRARAAVARLPDSQRIFGPMGGHGGRAAAGADTVDWREAPPG